MAKKNALKNSKSKIQNKSGLYSVNINENGKNGKKENLIILNKINKIADDLNKKLEQTQIKSEIKPETIAYDDKFIFKILSKDIPINDLFPSNKNSNSDDAKIMSAKAATLYSQEVALYKSSSHKRPGKDLLSEISKAGATRDKLYSLSLAIQKSPLHFLDELRKLLEYATSKKCRDAVVAVELLKDLFVNHLLPDEQLQNFEEISSILKSGKICAHKLILAYYESELKQVYGSFISYLAEKLNENTFEWFRIKLLKFSFELLSAKPEGEEVILSFLINNFAAFNKKIVSRTLFYFTNLLEQHPGMKKDVAKEVKIFVLRKNHHLKSQYYAICLLNQFKYTKSEQEKKLAGKVAKIYIDVFSVLHPILSKKKLGEESKELFKLISLIFTGINRALPYADYDLEILNDKIDILYKTSHMPYFNMTLQALSLLYNIYTKQSLLLPSRFYVALYSSLLSEDLASFKKLAMYLSLIFRSIKMENNPTRIIAFVKRILQVCTTKPASIACACLLTISELAKLKKCIRLHAERIKKLFPLDQKNKATNKIESFEHGECAEYLPYKRDPQFSSADSSTMFELLFFLNHYHPVVAHFARKLVDGEAIDYQGDPVEDLSLMSFLEKFVLNRMAPKHVSKSAFSKKRPLPKAEKASGANRMVKRGKSSKGTPEPNGTVFEGVERTFFDEYLKRKSDEIGDFEVDPVVDKGKKGKKTMRNKKTAQSLFEDNVNDDSSAFELEKGFSSNEDSMSLSE